MRNDDQWRNRRDDEFEMDREFPRDRDYGAGSRYPRDEPFQFGDTDRGPRGGSYRESGRQYGGYDQPGRSGESGQGYGGNPRYGDRLQSVQGGNFGRGDPYADEGRYGGSRHEGYGLTGQRYGHEEELSSPGGPQMNWEGRGQRHPQYDWPSRGTHEGREQGYGGWTGSHEHGPGQWGGSGGQQGHWQGGGQQEWQADQDWQGGRQGGQRHMPKGYKRSDERLQEDICERLSRSGLDVSEVSVSVSEGRVTLEGSVNERYMKHAIEDCADDCMGVESVENRIRVDRAGARSGTGGMGASGSMWGESSSSSTQQRNEMGASSQGGASGQGNLSSQAGTSNQAGEQGSTGSSGQQMQGEAAEKSARSPRKTSGQSKRK